MNIQDLTEEELEGLLASNGIYKTKKAYCFMFSSSMHHMYLNLMTALLEATVISNKEAASYSMAYTTPAGKPEMTKLLCELKGMVRE